MNVEVFRLVFSLAVEFSWKICEMDIKAAYLQAQGFERDIYVRPPQQENAKGFVWKLTKAAYGLADSGRLWYLTSDAALREAFGATRSRLEHTLYYRRNDTGALSFVLVAQVDNYVYAGTPSEITAFESFLQEEFHVGELEHGRFVVYGCEIEQHTDMSATVRQRAKLAEVPTQLPRSVADKARSGNEPATPAELTDFKSILGKLLFVGRLTQPVLLRIASHFATKTLSLRAHHLKDLEAQLRHWKRVEPCIHFARPARPSPFILDVYTDAAMSSKKDPYARGGYVIYRRCGDIVHPIHWSSRKLRRVARSSTTAEILATADAFDMGLYLKALLAELTYDHELHLNSDSRSVFNLSSTTKEPEERVNKLDLAAMREAHENGELAVISRTPGYYLVADALTKDNRETAALLLRTLRDGLYPLHPEAQHRTSPKGGVRTD